MSKFISRTLTTTEVKFVTVEVKEGDKVVTSEENLEVLEGEVSKEKALEELHKKIGNNVIISIHNIVTKIQKYALELDAFLSLAKVVNQNDSVDEA